MDTTLSTILFCAEPEVNEINLSNIDPTVVIKLHSILSGIDIFHLNQEFDYHITGKSKELVSMVIPEPFKNLLSQVDDQNMDEIIAEWTDSEEVRLCQWDSNQAEIYLFSLSEISKRSTESIKLKMYMNSKPPFCL